MKSIYTELPDCGNHYRIQYLDGIRKIIEDRKAQAMEKRNRIGKDIQNHREEYRNRLRNMLGWPLNVERQPILNSRETVLEDHESHKISRIQLEIFEGFWFYGILMQHKTDKKLPLVLSQHGGEGTPEIACSFFDSANYNDMSIRIFAQNVNVFAPQMLLWQKDTFGPDNCRNDIDKDLKQLGSSIAALEIYCIQKCMDYFETKEYCDKNFGMAGLSYGGFYTLFSAAIDTRIKAALSSSQFNDRITYNWSDWVWFDSANQFLDAQVGALVCPRALRIEVGDKDELFDADTAAQEYDCLKHYYEEKAENLEFIVFRGTHEFNKDDDGIKWLVSKL